MTPRTLAIDFGTSNSAAAVLDQGRVRRIPVEPGKETLPTAVFFPADHGGMQIGAAATRALIAGHEGRYMRALKSVLGLPLLHERRVIGGQRRSIAEIITAFLRVLRDRAEAETGMPLRHALSGRPVYFHTAHPDRDAQAEADLRACYEAAGFESVRFLAEPEAAAISSGDLGGADGIGLVVDIGGGTSDFSVFRSSGDRPEILASHGIRLGGTDFDRALSLAHVMPALGLGTQVRREMGPGLLPVPRAPYIDLATWAHIPFLYTPQTRRMMSDLFRLAQEPKKINRFLAVLEMELGHDIAFAVERGKIDANDGGGEGIDLSMVEAGLSVPLAAGDLDTTLADSRTDLRTAAAFTLEQAGVAGPEVSRIILVGGSSLMGLVSSEMRMLCPAAKLHQAGAFTAVVDGLALAEMHQSAE